jgi:hypothetical protein
MVELTGGTGLLFFSGKHPLCSDEDYFDGQIILGSTNDFARTPLEKGNISNV